MSKIRIYELAKELGIDNKVVINKALEVGVQGKLSHSSSLDADEADQIRRAIIRQAIGVSPEKQIVTTRIDHVTGEAATVVESRKGNVIRRRKKEVVEELEAVQERERRAEEREAQQEEQRSAETGSVLPAAEEEISQEGAVPEPLSAEAGLESQAEAEGAAQEEEVESSTEAAGAPDETVGEESRKTIGPKVLGKIALPQKKAPRAAAKKSMPALQVVAPRADLEDDEEGKGKKGLAKRKSKKREISRMELLDYEGRPAPRRGTRGKGKTREGGENEGQITQGEATAPRAAKRIVKMGADTITVGELAHQMSVRAGEVIAKLMELGIMATINQIIDRETTTLMAEEFGFQVESTGFDESLVLQDQVLDDPATMRPRAPVVTVMGHVDHGKTSLLDYVRHTAVAAREHGGITQHIGAYTVSLDDGRKIAFIDTPGHAAFTSMRARGAQVTDIVVLVVAADDGVMPQTIEAINHAKAAGVPIVVAVNKIDKPNVAPDRIRKQLSEHGLSPENWGGETLFFDVSALKGTGVKELLEGILLVAELKELKANPERRALGAVIEARQDKGRGTVATVLVRAGTLRIGDIFVCGAESGRVRSMNDSEGQKLEAAGPSTPVELTGLSGIPMAGDDFVVVESENAARQVALARAEKKRLSEQRGLAGGPISLEEFARRANNALALELNVVLKADVHGSLEAVRSAVENLSNDKVKVRVLHAGVGGVNESDIQLAVASRALVVGFGVRAESRAMTEAENAGIEVRFYRIIYELVDDVKAAMAGLLAPVRKEVYLGRAEVRDTFTVPKIGTVAGCYVADGIIKRGAQVRLVRDSRVVHEGRMGSLRRFKDDVREVASGYECGLSIEGFNDIKLNDVLEIFEVKEIAATLE